MEEDKKMEDKKMEEYIMNESNGDICGCCYCVHDKSLEDGKIKRLCTNKCDISKSDMSHYQRCHICYGMICRTCRFSNLNHVMEYRTSHKREEDVREYRLYYCLECFSDVIDLIKKKNKSAGEKNKKRNEKMKMCHKKREARE